MTELEVQAFLKVLQSGSITAAAEQLYITQPALSRRLRSLETELGCKLFTRGPGQQAVELTAQGQYFVPVAEKWLEVWAEARALSNPRPKELNISSIGSVSTYLLAPVFRRFMEQEPDCRLNFHNYHYTEAYEYVAKGEVELAFISDDQYHRTVETVPAYRVPFVLAAVEMPNLPEKVHPTQLDGSREIRLPWNPEYDAWHDYWFGHTQRPKVYLDIMSLMEQFLQEPGSWVILPATAAAHLTGISGLVIHQLEQGPPDRIIYYIHQKGNLPPLASEFLHIFGETLREEENVECFL